MAASLLQRCVCTPQVSCKGWKGCHPLTNNEQLTAETIAEATRKPLFIVSVAEIGLDASKAEKNLEQMFYLAGVWEAILLV
jgi:Tat protein secretion system quality control protein TatD with DNase activity